MKVLLLGDFSSVQLNLKEGLESLGHAVTLISHGDGFKNLKSDIRVYTRSAKENKLIGATKEIVHQVTISNKIKNYDVVQTAAHIFFHNRIDPYLFPKIFERNKKTVLLNTACSVPYNRFVRELEYSPCSECKKTDLKNGLCDHEKPNAEHIEYERYKKYNAIVSTHFEYYHSFNKTPFQDKNYFIPVPINLKHFEYVSPKIDGKINLYYGEIRKGFKGGRYIEEALERLKDSSYSKYFNIVTTNRVSYAEYLNVIKNCHVLVDQSSSYSYGVNALIGLSLGKVVLSGAEPEAIKMLQTDTSKNPIINILPSSEDIFNKLVWLANNRDQIIDISRKSRLFVEEFHSLDKIAKQYEQLYLKI